MSGLVPILQLAALVGAGLIAGVFFAFSSFVMGALARLPYPQGLAAMQSINVVVLNRSFLGLFLGTAVLSLLLALIALAAPGRPGALPVLAGAVLYLAGTFLVTVAGNVPLNERLAPLAPEDEDAWVTWRHYLRRWTALNSLRAGAAAAATVLFAVAWLHGGP